MLYMQVLNGLSGAGQRCHTVHHEMNGSRTRSTITMKTSINEAKKAIWLRLQSYVSDPDMWESEIEEENWDPDVFDNALTLIFLQLENKL